MTTTTAQPSRHVWSGDMHEHEPMTADEFRAQVVADALHAGFDPEMAAWLAEQVANPPPDGVVRNVPEAAQRFLDARMPREALVKIAALYGAESLVPELHRSGLSLHRVAALLADAMGTAPAITPEIFDNLRAHLLAINHWESKQ